MLRLALPVILAAAAFGCDGINGPAGPAGPEITSQPRDVTINEGASATFSVTATGAAPLSYQWKRNGSVISGATQSTYAISAATAADGDARFFVVVTDGSQSVESREAVLTVRTMPRLATQPQSRAVLSGTPASFSITATGADLSYQWYRNGKAIPGSKKNSYAVGVPLAGDNGAIYSVAVSNALGSVTSAEATLGVNTGTGLRPTSYSHAKGRNQGPVTVPAFSLARTFGDFFGGEGRDYFIATQVYDHKKPQSEAKPGESLFWRWTGASYVRETAKIDDPTGCLHPRKAVVADYNGDQKSDVFVVCHGYDAKPFPGELNYVLLSQSSGVYTRRTVPGGPGFYHSAAAFDINNDGYVDLVATDNFAAQSVFAFVNDGQGNFTLRSDLFSLGRANYYSVEAVDVDGDGRTDVLAGGHEYQGATTVVLLNDGSGSFAAAKPHVLPAVPNEAIVLDFVVFDANLDGTSEIYVVRTSGGDGTFYESRTVQRVEWPSLSSTVLISERGKRWIDFLFPVFSSGRYSLVSDNTTLPFSLALP